MTLIVFGGPSLAPGARERFPELSLRGPARQGDVYLALRESPKAIGIIDGFFDAVPSVWHKEVLWAMAQGVHILGASSIGALRAAELESFGMEGVGSVYEAFRDGALEDDDEVAVTHGPLELGHRPLTLAMVSIRATLAAFPADKLEEPTSLALYRDAAKALGYRERTVSRISARALERGGHRADIDTLAAQVSEKLVDVKAEDAETLLTMMRDRAAEFLEPKTVRYTFNDTSAWRAFVAWAEGQAWPRVA
ncbi:TfuA-like protein [Thalassobaculum litoreum]|uniref:TfuA-like core domain-containing protein n=1 Tax=Thalassobaculum litoreum DSM 18839 TaxID=1123362 RepID=A0A8G2BFB4_9PROT|nr:TfuA-like protein [Thalassobaculum litoreum]SDF05567.1 hypothetical protein SAMN05660686_00061 [Thalassobaculum litoreum DSM 18839]